MADSGAVAGLLWDRWLPERVRQIIAAPLPGGADDGRRLVVWLATVHDIGKATPAFACQVDVLADHMRDAGLDMVTQRQMGPDRRMAPHALAGQLLLQEWLEESRGWPGRMTPQFAVAVGGHHGAPPDHPQVHDLDVRPGFLRSHGPSEDRWREVQRELLEACAEDSGAGQRLADWSRVKLPQTVQVLLSALVIMADWIASNQAYFPYFPEDAPRTEAERVEAGWAALGLPDAWRPGVPQESVGDLFASRFALPAGARPRPVQEAVVRMARGMAVPGLMIVEAPMGEGKTEAALAAAEVLAARSGAGGVLFALPTMATGNAMFPRLLAWLDRLPAAADERLSVRLAHSKAALNEDFTELKSGARRRFTSVDAGAEEQVPAPGAVHRLAPAELIAHQWLDGRKKSLLASFVVGTIDQLLFAGLKSRHLALRHLALAGKVVVIDEAHAYDTYMNSYLDRVLAWLGEYGVPVVVLSATLPARRRRELAAAYAGADAADENFAAVEEARGYPLLTGVAPGHPPCQEVPAASGRGTSVRVEAMDDDLGALADLLDGELAGGGCALVVRNTVARVLDTAQALRERFGPDDVTVAHARFLDLDRAEKDADLLRRFGPRSTTRPARHIVVASQVAEQSLDVDFDLLVTDLAPVDLVLQRMGRLHRHPREDRPERLRQARCLVTGVGFGGEVPPRPVRGSELVYGCYPLLRSLAALLPHLHAGGTGGERTGRATGGGLVSGEAGPGESARPVRLPEDISTLVQDAYADVESGPASWAPVLAEARAVHQRIQADKELRADAFRLSVAGKAGRSIVGWLGGGAGDADDTRAGRAQVRDSQESLEVIVVQRLADGSLATVDWASGGRGGLRLPQDSVPAPRAARAAAACGLRLPLQLSQPRIIDRVIAELEEFCVPAWQSKDSPWLAGELILPIQADCQTQLAGYAVQYSRDEGLKVQRER
ncbi:MAG TPA: CRISPR-associated helicase Cas3' [Streptomyces sp.]|nr:CRISPR-associated helicase Cas3' [Streptomyces sp.]